MKQLSISRCMIFGALLLLAVASIVRSDEVYRLMVELSGRESINDDIGYRTITSRTLMSSVLGTPPDQIPDDYVLALKVACDEPGVIVVWNKAKSHPVKRVATVSPVMIVSDPTVFDRKIMMVVDVDLVATNWVANLATNVPSNWRMVMRGDLDDSLCATKLSGRNSTGAINLIDENGVTNSILIVRGTVTTGSLLGTTTDPE